MSKRESNISNGQKIREIFKAINSIKNYNCFGWFPLFREWEEKEIEEIKLRERMINSDFLQSRNATIMYN